jgi:peptidoglycan/LPS O-acetylase OafA/YrhL
VAENNNFNLIRLIAAAEVVYMHATAHLGLPQFRATMYLADILPGVPIFFVVSGFLVTNSFIKSEAGTLAFFWRRGLRIYPGLWINIGAILALLMLTRTVDWHRVFTAQFWQWTAITGVMGSNFYGNLLVGPIIDYSAPHFYTDFPSGVLWTLNVELGFYLLVPIAFCRYIMAQNWRWAVWLGLFVVSLCSEAVLANRLNVAPNINSTTTLFCSPAPFFWIFLLGAMAAVHWGQIRHLFEGKFVWWAAAYVALTWADTRYFGHETLDVNYLVGQFVIPRMVLLAGVTLSAAHSFIRMGSPVRKFDISYGTYLYHMQIIASFEALNIKGYAWQWVAIYAATFTLAAVSWWCVEKPAQRLKSFVPRTLSFKIPSRHSLQHS